jgi:hypothetical protein
VAVLVAAATATLLSVPVASAAADPVSPPPAAPTRDLTADDEILRSAADPATPGYPVATCGWSNDLAEGNPADSIMAGTLRLPGFPDLKIGTGAINWAADPYRHRTWRLWFGTLKWAEGLLSAWADTGNRAYLDRASDIARDFVRSNPDPGNNTNLWVDHSTSLRTSFLLCLEQHTGRTEWLDAAINTHAAALASPRRYAGAYNHGIMQNIALLGAACVRGRDDWRSTAVSRQTVAAASSLDGQGVLDEQAPGYATFLYDLWQAVVSYHRQCGAPVPTGLEERLAKVHEFAAHATTPDGNMIGIGDTGRHPVIGRTGPWAQYAATLGTSGTQPASRVAVFTRGYVFGRSGWGTGRPYTDEQQYSIRFGPARIRHGHNDHLGVTFYSGGRNVLVDSGFDGYNDRAYEAWTRSPEAHSVPVLPGVAFDQAARTPWPKSAVARGVRAFEFNDRAYARTTRHRTVAVVESGGPMLVRDDVSTDRARQIRVLWHLDPTWRLERTYNGRVQSRATFLSPDGKQRAWVIQLAGYRETLPRSASVVIKGRRAPLQGWVDSRIPAPVVEAQRYGKRVTTLTAILVLPTDAGLAASRQRYADGKETIRLTSGKSVWVFRTSPAGAIWGG